MSESVYIDSLTLLVNRRFLQIRIRQALDELQQSGRCFGVLLADVDKFEQINAAYRRVGGDVVLQSLARTLSSSLRAGDTVGRWSGDEFLAILPGADLDGTLSLAERCRMLVRNSTVSVDGHAVSTTISIGATMLSEADSLESCFHRVGRALYGSKQKGRDRTNFLLS